MTQETVSTSITLDKDLHRQMKAMLAMEGMTINGYVAGLIRDDMAKRNNTATRAKIRKVEDGVVTLTFNGKLTEDLKTVFKERKWIRWEKIEKKEDGAAKTYWNLVLDMRDDTGETRYSSKKIDFLYAAFEKGNVDVYNYDNINERWRECAKSYFTYLIRSSCENGKK